MITEQFQIIEAFSKGLKIELTINQISKIIDKSYAFTNKYTHDLIEKGVLTSKTIGPSLLCSLDYSNEETIACLTYVSIMKNKRIQIDKTPAIREIKEKFCKDTVAFVVNAQVYVIAGEEKAHSYGKYKILMITPESLNKILSSLDFSRLTILNGHERFWREMKGNT